MPVIKWLTERLEDQEDAPENPLQLIFTSLWRTRLGRACLTIITVIVLFGILYDAIAKAGIFFSPKSKDTRTMPTQPRVVIVTPTEPADHFAVLHLYGLQLGLDHTQIGPPLEIGGEASAFKVDKIDDQIIKLKSHLDRNEVVAVIAPSITEATVSVLEAVSEYDTPVPVFLESSIPWDDIGAYNEKLTIFRLSSGIGERGTEVARISEQLKSNGFDIWFVAETVSGEISYGERLLNHALRGPGKSTVPGNQRVRFSREDPIDASDSPLKDLPFDDPGAVIFVFALGDDFSKILTAYYQRSHQPRARIVGVMTAYKLETTVTKDLAHALIYDISDLDTRPGLAKDDEAQVFYDAYKLQYGVPNPTHRDQAFSFDAALVLSRAFGEDLRDLPYAKGLRKFSQRIAKINVTGVTGQVKFRNPRVDFKSFFQNDQSNIRIVQFDPTRDKGDQWSDVNWKMWKP